MSITIRLTKMPEQTNFAPLGVLGYCLTRTEFLSPVWDSVEIPLKTVDHSPTAKLQDILVSILAGCRAISQVNTRLRPEVVLAQAWGRERFADQSMPARTLDSCGMSQVAQLRQGSQALLRREGQVFTHNFAQEWLYLDIDLTPLPISKQAESSTKGKFEKKTAMGGNWPGCMRPNTTKRSSRGFIRVSRIVARPIFRCWRLWHRALTSARLRSSALSCAPMLALAQMPMSTTP